ncbi:MAG: DNA mismatch repair protein MutS [Deltaproteobacteria bacterium]|nr:DNA mismatch repair protein MutS [Deltaproteobacteria bacterium]
MSDEKSEPRSSNGRRVGSWRGAAHVTPNVPRSVEERLSDAHLTPMMRQYLSVKASYPHALIFFRMGDFFETFFEDAVESARLLDLTLTARSKERDVPMAGVPHHAVDGYLARLVEAGRTVVLVDQVEDPRQAKGLVRREVTRVLSPGTFVDPNAPARTPSYLLSLAFEAGKNKKPLEWGLAALDLSTGEFKATAGLEAELLFDEIGRLGPRELLVSEAWSSHAFVARLREEFRDLAITQRPNDEFLSTAAVRVLTEAFGADEVRGYGVLLSAQALAAAAVAYHYARVTQLRPEAVDLVGNASLRHICGLRPYLPGDALVLDAQARAHLELFKTPSGGRQDSLLEAIDDASTAMGGRLLARWLSYPLVDRRGIVERQDAIEAFVQRPSVLDKIRRQLRSVADLERLLGRVVMGRVTTKDLGVLRDSLREIPNLLELVGRIGDEASHDDDSRAARSKAFDASAIPSATSAATATAAATASMSLRSGQATHASARLSHLASVDRCREVFARLDAALVDAPSSDVDSGVVFRPGYDCELDTLDDIARNGKSMIAALETKEREATGISSLKVRYNRVFGYFIEITKTNLKLVPERYIRKQTTVNGERYFTDELKQLEAKVLSAAEDRAIRSQHLFRTLVNEIAGAVGRLRTLVLAVAEIDVYAGLSHLAETRNWTRPLVDEGLAIRITEGRHPVIERRSADLGERFVPNDVTLDSEARLLVLTGPNMAGKSTIMRQTALIVILAHMGAFVPARSAQIGLVDRVFTRVGASDDLSKGRSTFMVEMNETARILRSATERSLIVLDEIGRGTSTFDGLSIAWAVAEYLHDVIQARTLFATHYHELTELSRDKPRAANFHVAVKEWNEQIIFLRKLMPGPTNRSYGVHVARLAGLPKGVVDRAREVLDSLEAHDLAAGHASKIRHLLSRRFGDDAASNAPQMHLFGDRRTHDEPAEHEPHGSILQALRALSPDDLTPRQALDQIARWHAQLSSGAK